MACPEDVGPMCSSVRDGGSAQHSLGRPSHPQLRHERWCNGTLPHINRSLPCASCASCASWCTWRRPLFLLMGSLSWSSPSECSESLWGGKGSDGDGGGVGVKWFPSLDSNTMDKKQWRRVGSGLVRWMHFEINNVPGLWKGRNMNQVCS